MYSTCLEDYCLYRNLYLRICLFMRLNWHINKTVFDSETPRLKCVNTSTSSGRTVPCSKKKRHFIINGGLAERKKYIIINFYLLFNVLHIFFFICRSNLFPFCKNHVLLENLRFFGSTSARSFIRYIIQFEFLSFNHLRTLAYHHHHHCCLHELCDKANVSFQRFCTVEYLLSMYKVIVLSQKV
jgi:hypothetical protein